MEKCNIGKVCVKCGIEKDLTEFHKRRAVCKLCYNAERVAYYHTHVAEYHEKQSKYRCENREKINERQRRAYYKYKEKSMETRRAYQRRSAEFVDSLKTPCRKCGESRLYLIQFHHIDPKDKLYLVQYGRSNESILKESKKCLCLCSNCHTEFHYIYGKQPKTPVSDLIEYLGEEVYYESERDESTSGDNQ